MQANLPNSLTVSRILATPVVCILLFYETAYTAWVALTVYIFACVTDFLDGYIARIWRQQSSFGRFLDPIADKLLVGLVLLMLVGIDRLQGLNILPAAVILWREIMVSGLREYLAGLNVGMPVTRLSKWKTTLQMTAVGFLVVGPHGPDFGTSTTTDLGIWGLWLATMLTFATGYDYLRAGLAHLGAGSRIRRAQPLKGADAAGDTR